MKLKFNGVCYLPKKEMHLINGLVEKLASLTSISTAKEETGVKPVSSKVKIDDCLPSKKEISDSAKKAAEEIIDDTFKKYFGEKASEVDKAINEFFDHDESNRTILTPETCNELVLVLQKVAKISLLDSLANGRVGVEDYTIRVLLSFIDLHVDTSKINKFTVRAADYMVNQIMKNLHLRFTADGKITNKEISDSANKAAEEIIVNPFKKYVGINANKPNSCKIDRSRKTGITWAEAQYCSVWEIWRRHHSEDQWKWNGKSAGRSTIGNLINKAMKYIPLESLEKWDYAPGFDEPYSEHKREVILRAIEGTSTRFIDVVSSCFHDAHRMDKENERIRNSCK